MTTRILAGRGGRRLSGTAPALSPPLPIAHPATGRGTAETSSNGSRRLRRATAVANLRQDDASSLCVEHDEIVPRKKKPPFGGNFEIFEDEPLDTEDNHQEIQRERQEIEEIPQGIELNQVDSSTPGGSFVEFVPINMGRIGRWAHTSTTVTQGNPPSPLTPRRFTEEELNTGVLGHHAESEAVAHQVDGGHDQAEQYSSSPDDDDSIYGGSIDDTGAVRSALEQMWRVNRSAVELGTLQDIAGPPRAFYKGKEREITYSSPPKPKPPPIRIPEPGEEDQPIHPRSGNSDPQTYSGHGLNISLRKVYYPAPVPSPVFGSLRKPLDFSQLGNPLTPTGQAARYRADAFGDLAVVLDSKDCNYIAFFIDTMLARIHGASGEMDRLEEAMEDKEVDKANLQASINAHYHEACTQRERVKNLEGLMGRMLWMMHGAMRDRACDVGQHWGIDVPALLKAQGLDESTLKSVFRFTDSDSSDSEEEGDPYASSAALPLGEDSAHSVDVDEDDDDENEDEATSHRDNENENENENESDKDDDEARSFAPGDDVQFSVRSIASPGGQTTMMTTGRRLADMGSCAIRTPTVANLERDMETLQKEMDMLRTQLMESQAYATYWEERTHTSDRYGLSLRRMLESNLADPRFGA